MRSTKVGREAPKYLLRIPAELRAPLDKEASLNGRSLNSEILHRLTISLGPQGNVPKNYRASEPRREEPLNDAERKMLALFRRWPAEKQLALLSLFK